MIEREPMRGRGHKKPYKIIREKKYKECNICKFFLPLTYFYKDKTKHDGFMSACKKCDDYKNRKNKIRKIFLKYMKNLSITTKEELIDFIFNK